MTEATDFWAAAGQCVSAAAAIIGFGFVGWQIKSAKNAFDLQTLQAFNRDCSDREHALMNATDPDKKDQAFIEYMNTLEMYAAAWNAKIFPTVSKTIVRDKLRDAIAIISSQPQWHSKIEEAISSSETFTQLRKFMKKHKTYIDNLVTKRIETTN